VARGEPDGADRRPLEPPREDVDDRKVARAPDARCPQGREPAGRGDHTEREVSANDYNFFNLFTATREEVRFFSYDGQLRMTRGREGLNVLTNAGGNVEGDEKVTTIRSLGRDTRFVGGDKAIAWLQSTLRYHGGSGSAALCVHFPGGGTVSSTILALHNADPGQHVLLHANGSPCENPYRDYSALLRQLNPGRT